MATTEIITMEILETNAILAMAVTETIIIITMAGKTKVTATKKNVL